MSELLDNIKSELVDEETRNIYAEDFLNAYIATQIKVLREERGWTQSELAELAGMKQERISVLEDVNYEAWTAKVLKRLARALGVRLVMRFDSFGSYLDEFEKFGRDSLQVPSFENDPVFQANDNAEVFTGLGREEFQGFVIATSDSQSPRNSSITVTGQSSFVASAADPCLENVRRIA